ncbi:MAG: deoxynucleoside kinase [Paludibacteraceae bacterium]|nr:deoxynucleoside kinase [Paludibacteraceae bacterium]
MKYLAVAGNIGVGKTTLTRMLAQHYKLEPYFEPSIENPYLDDFYQDTPRWAFAMEIFYLKKRFEDIIDILQRQVSTIQDRTIFESVSVFAKNNYLQGNLDQRDYETFMELFSLMINKIRYPDLLIYLRADVSKLVTQIQKRGRTSEQSLKLDYLKGLNKHYEDFYVNYPNEKIVIEMDDCDFEHNADDFSAIIDKIDKNLNKLF